MQKVTKTFTNEHRKICKISLQKNTSNSSNFGRCIVDTLGKNEIVKHDNKSIIKVL